MNKNELRKYYLEKRSTLSQEQFLKLNQGIVDNLFAFLKPSISEIKYLHIYLPIKGKNEIDTLPIIKHLQENYPKLVLVLSKSDFSTFSMEHFVFTDKTFLSENKMGIIEPSNGEKVPSENIDLVIVPLLAIDKKGHRLGYGKGFYDRFLAQCSNKCLKIGLSYESPIESVHPEKYDFPLDSCITPDAVILFEKHPNF